MDLIVGRNKRYMFAINWVKMMIDKVVEGSDLKIVLFALASFAFTVTYVSFRIPSKK